MSSQPSLATCLPDDVLFEIYSQLVCSYDLAKDWLDVFHAQVGLLHVCSKWRQAARECKALWASIPTFKHNWSEMALQLSAPLPIDVTLVGGDFEDVEAYDEDAPSTFDDRFLPALLAETYRMRSLFLHGDDEGYTYEGAIAAMNQIGAQATPLLERVEFYGAMNFVDDYPDILRNFFSTVRPKMLYMTLSGTIFSCVDLSLSSLTQLHIEWGALAETPQKFLEFLSTMPSLSVLSIKYFDYFTHEEHPPLVPRSISLPKLTEFTYAATIVLEIDISHSLHSAALIPVLSIINDHFDVLVQDGASFHDIQIFSFDNRIAIIAKDFENSPKVNQVPDADTSESHSINKHSVTPPTLLKVFVCVPPSPSNPPNPPISHDTIVVDITKSLPVLFNARCLSIMPSGLYFPLEPQSTGNLPRDARFWSSLLEHFSGIEILEISASDWVSLSHYIGMATKEAALVLRLQELHVKDMSNGGSEFAQETTDWVAVVNATKELSRNSLRLIKIELGDWEMSAKLLEDLREIVEVTFY